MLSIDEKNIKRKEYQRRYRERTGHRCTWKYEKTPKGFLMRLYRNMQSRIYGIQKEKWHLYKGKELISRQDFYNWALPHKDFKRLYRLWIQSTYNRKLTPTVDRIDPTKGYSINNMRWITHSENSRLGGIHRSQLYPDQVKTIVLERWKKIRQSRLV